jgi:predicted outer membrane protein
MIKKPFIATLLVALISAVACSKKRETIARNETILQDSIATGLVSDDTLDEFEYEADSLETDESEN